MDDDRPCFPIKLIFKNKIILKRKIIFMFCKVRHKNLTVSKHVFFVKPGFHSIYYIGTMPRLVIGENLFFVSQFSIKKK